MGVALVQLNRVDEAYPFFVRAAQDEPNDPVARLNIGAYLQQHGRTADAIQQYELALDLGAEPGMRAATYANLGLAYSELGDYGKARSSFQQSLRLNPGQPGPWQGLALISQKQGNPEEAIPYFARSVELQPSAQGYLQLASLLAQTNHRAEAFAAYQQAVRMDPSLIESQPAGQKPTGQH